MLARGFTVVEMLIAVAAVTLLAVGIAQVFRATGETVKIGRRVSNLNTYASMIERQMRRDFESMTRDGFFVIRHEHAAGGVPAALAPDDPAPRPRRVDSMVFFATGDFASLRDPVVPGRLPRSSEARIYYGHGLRQDPSDSRSLRPVRLDDDNADISLTPPLGAPGPNRYGIDWILQRHVGLLATPNQALLDPLPANLAEPSASEVPDNGIQNQLQPAVSSLFRNLAAVTPVVLPPDAAIVRDGAVERPGLTCGAVDVISQGLHSIRAVVLDAQDPFAVSAPFDVNADDPGVVFPVDPFPGAPGFSTRIMQDWMQQAFPGPIVNNQSVRIRCEPAPPDYMGTIWGGGSAYQKEYQRTDQLMLSSFNFVPHCTEFIVEWSFGVVYPPNHPTRPGQLAWHGLPRLGDLDGNGTPELIAWPYGWALGPGGDGHATIYRRADGTVGFYAIPPLLIHNFPLPLGPVIPVEHSYFGYVNPAYQPGPGDPETLPWPWPKLVRVTMSLVDPTDALNEQTFQFTFEVPEAHVGREH